MDTVLQHARMYGYREEIMPYTRVFLPHVLATLFSEIHESEESLRAIVAQQRNGEAVPVMIAPNARPTRPGVLESGLRLYRRGLTQISPYQWVEDREIGRQVYDLLVGSNVQLDASQIADRPTRVPLCVIRRIVELLDTGPDDPGRWSSPAVLGLISAHQHEYEQHGDAGIVYVRSFDARSAQRTRGRLQGQSEIPQIRAASPDAPALALLYHQSRNTEPPEIWYPTLVTQENMSNFIFGPV